MQKLVFRNSKGVEIDFTSGNYGVVDWNGFSENGLEIQSQKVPFVDGSVYLDSLLNERELAITLAYNDDKDLEKRYRLRREIISVLNPKLGEGTLIYTNDFLSKQIKVIANMPVFPNKNFDEGGTNKADISFVASSPYWEDIEATEIIINNNVSKIISNIGDVPTSINMEINAESAENVIIENITGDKKIDLSGSELNGFYEIQTAIGNKKIEECELVSNSKAVEFRQVIEFNDKFYGISNKHLYISEDSKNWVLNDLNNITGYTKLIIFPNETNYLYLICSYYDGSANEYYIYRISNTEEKELIYTTNVYISDIAYSPVLHLYCCACTTAIYTTTNLSSNWELRISDNNYHDCVIWAGNRFITGGRLGYAYYSNDGVTFEKLLPTGLTDDYRIFSLCETPLGVFGCSSYGIIYKIDNSNRYTKLNTSNVNINELKSIIYNSDYNVIISAGTKGTNRPINLIYISYDGLNWNTVEINENISSIFFSQKNKYFLFCSRSMIYSYDLLHFSSQNSFPLLNNLIYINYLNIYVGVGNSGNIYTSFDLVNFEKINIGINNLKFVSFNENTKMVCVVGDNILGYSYNCKDWKYINHDYSNVTSLTFMGNDFYFGCYTNVTSIVFNNKIIKFDTNNISTSIYFTRQKQNYKFSNIINFKENLLYTLEYEIFFNNTSFLLNKEIRTLFYSDNLNLLIGIGITVGKLLISYDGKIWNEIDLPSNIYFTMINFIPLKNKLIGIDGTGQIWQSIDGYNWELTNEKEDNVNYIIPGKEEYLYLKNENVILTTIKNRINRINLMKAGDLNLGLLQGNNVINLSCSSGKLSAKLKFKNKYVGV